MTAPVITGGSITGVALSGNTLTNPVITGGSINNTTVGATTRSTGAFTTLASNGATTFTAGTASTSTTTGTAVITGGLGVSGRINAANFDGIVGANTAAAGNFTTLGATGVATFSAGTVSAPAITTTGDTNTGIFFPAADTIAFTEGGVEAMRIDSSGNLLVGTTTANAKVYAVGTSGFGHRYTGAPNDFIFTQFNTTGDASINNKAIAALLFATSNAERMRIDSSGNLGLGVTAPGAKLEIAGGTLGVITNGGLGLSADLNSGRLVTDGGTAALAAIFNTFNNNIVEISSGSSSGFVSGIALSARDVAGTSSDSVTLWTRSTERMKINGSGSVGIGTSSPAVKFHVAGTGNQAARIDSTNGGTTTLGFFAGATNIAGISANVGATNLTLNVGGTERMRIDSSGNLLVGTTTAGGKFNVSGITNITSTSGITSSNNEGLKSLTGVTSATLTTVATLTKPAGNSPIRRAVFTVTATNDGADAGYAMACSVREVLFSNYGGTTSIIKSTELSNNQGSILDAVIAVALTTEANLSGTSVLLQATATLSGASSAGLAARLTTKVEVISSSNYQDITFA
jgi:hypothetical protein